MRKIAPDRLAEIISAIFILVFVYAAVSKWMDIQRFHDVLAESPLIKPWAGLVSQSLPAIELAIATLLLIPATRLTGLRLSFLTMLLFTAYLGYMLVFIPNMPCSCGGILNNMSWTQHFIFNVLLTTLSALGIYFQKSHQVFIAINRNSRIPV